ncbi:MAG: rRNA pseudouridine synthase [Planctomycetes bacterium]|jgi:pseudouridine synthase|nr:rRNA pseudouridine synthase [Planctomycetota bacterium]
MVRNPESTDPRERLQKVLAAAGIASRRKCEELMLAGRVAVNGAVVRELGTKVDPATDDIRVDTVPLSTPKKPMALAVNKPRGLLCTAKDDRGRPTVLDMVPESSRRLYPVGRLDEDSEGLILLSDDGELTDLVTHPRYGIPKTYDLRIRGRLEAADIRRVESGVWLSEGRTARSRVRITKRGREISHVEVTLAEGRNRELRRIFARIGHPVLSLRRIRIGKIALAGLKPGAWRKLKAHEIDSLKAMARGHRTSR